MTPEDILKHEPIVLTPEQRQSFFEDGFLAVEGLVSDEWLECLRQRSEEMIDRSRQYAESNKEYDLSPDHTPDQPYVRRLRAPVDRHPDFWKFAHNSVFTDVAADLVGPDVKFHSCKLNYKHPGGGEVVKWHQDIPAWPHTNYSPVTLGVYLDTVVQEHGPLLCIPGSHNGPLFRHDNEDGSWRGIVADEDLATVDLDSAAALTGGSSKSSASACQNWTVQSRHVEHVSDGSNRNPIAQ